MRERLGKVIGGTFASPRIDQRDEPDHQQDRQSIEQGSTHGHTPYRSAPLDAPNRLNGAARGVGTAARLAAAGRATVEPFSWDRLQPSSRKP